MPRIFEKVGQRWEVCISATEGQFQQVRVAPRGARARGAPRGGGVCLAGREVLGAGRRAIDASCAPLCIALLPSCRPASPTPLPTLQVSFVNSICTSKGGTHVNYVTDQVTKWVPCPRPSPAAPGGAHLGPPPAHTLQGHPLQSGKPRLPCVGWLRCWPGLSVRWRPGASRRQQRALTCGGRRLPCRFLVEKLNKKHKKANVKWVVGGGGAGVTCAPGAAGPSAVRSQGTGPRARVLASLACPSAQAQGRPHAPACLPVPAAAAGPSWSRTTSGCLSTHRLRTRPSTPRSDMAGWGLA